MSWRYSGYKPYVPVAKRRAQAARELEKRRKKGEKVSPVVIEGRTIVSTFWGKAWCTNLEGFSDFENRLPRGRTYVRNGSVIDLKIVKGRINALVSGSEIYEITIEITQLPANAWKALKKLCAGKIGSLVELLQGKLSTSVMEAVTNRDEGLFPKPKEIRMRCTCPDYAGMCKHIAAVMYGIGNRLDASPEMLFELRGVDHRELIEEAIPAETARAEPSVPTVQESELGAIFGIEIGDAPAAPKPSAKRAAKKAAKAAGPQPAVKAAPAKQAALVKKAAPVKKAPAKKPVKAAGSAETKPAEAAKVKKSAASRKPAKPTSKKK